jgi:hypothetical protein
MLANKTRHDTIRGIIRDKSSEINFADRLAD